MKNFLLGIVIGYASSHSSKHLIHLTLDTLFGFQRRMGLSMATVTSLASHQTAKSYGKNSVAKIKTVIRYDPEAFQAVRLRQQDATKERPNHSMKPTAPLKGTERQ